MASLRSLASSSAIRASNRRTRSSGSADGTASRGRVPGLTTAAVRPRRSRQIWFKALTSYFTTNTDYASARKGTLSAASDLYGADSAECKAVDRAWAAVNVK
ncbi:M4 family metallopeptidase [Streptomyces sp. NPDC005480]|uniref:M4 family metallopeptidase n=1 Tax=Streptomyces sp. NPDC005480 TaxID=3154880 RepID=UPI0033B6B57C